MSKKMNKAAIIAMTGVMAASSIQTSTVFANDNVSATQDVKQKKSNSELQPKPGYTFLSSVASLPVVD